MRNRAVGSVLALSVLAAGSAVAAPTAETIAGNCLVCHSPSDAGQKGIPHIGGYAPNVMAKEMVLFKTDQRQGTIMNRIAKGLTDEQIQGLAVFFSQRPL